LNKVKYDASASVTKHDALWKNGTAVDPIKTKTELIKKVDGGLGNYDVTVDFIYEDVRIPIQEYQRTTFLPQLAIAEITNFGEAPSLFFYDGYIGVEPYQNLPEDLQHFSFTK
jgi:hypothetical protein